LDLPDVKGVGSREGSAEVAFHDGVTLSMRPMLKRGEPVGVEGALFRRGDDVVAEMVVEEGEGWAFRESGLSAEAAGSYVAAATEAERTLYKAYRSGKIPRDEWIGRFRDFWKVSIKSRKLLAALKGGEGK